MTQCARSRPLQPARQAAVPSPHNHPLVRAAGACPAHADSIAAGAAPPSSRLFSSRSKAARRKERRRCWAANKQEGLVLIPSPSPAPRNVAWMGTEEKMDLLLAAARLCLGVQPAGRLQEDPFMEV